jgi:hypothetical protein
VGHDRGGHVVGQVAGEGGGEEERQNDQGVHVELKFFRRTADNTLATKARLIFECY